MANNHRNRPRKPARRAPTLQPKPLILVVCEGKVTEREYLIGSKNACHNPRVEIEFHPERGIPLTLVQMAKERKKAAQKDAKPQRDANLIFDEVWCVFDIDEHPYIPDAVQMARDNGIKLAISNPCIELWLLLHFQDAPGMNPRQKDNKITEVLCNRL